MNGESLITREILGCHVRHLILTVRIKTHCVVFYVQLLHVRTTALNQTMQKFSDLREVGNIQQRYMIKT